VQTAKSPASIVAQDESDGTFTITGDSQQPSITITSPISGKYLSKGSTYTITWTGPSSGVVPKVKIDLRSTAPGYEQTAWGPGFVPNTGSYQWTVPDSPQIPEGVIDSLVVYDPNSPSDRASITVKVAGKPLTTVLSPNGGETLVQGQTFTVRWTTSPAGIPSYVGLNLLKDGNHVLGIGNVPNTGSFAWQVPSMYSGSGFKVNAYGEGNVDESDAPFTITAPAGRDDQQLPPPYQPLSTGTSGGGSTGTGTSGGGPSTGSTGSPQAGSGS